jgi:hypothetical protein
MEKTTELLFLKKKIHELIQDKVDIDEVQQHAAREL